MRAGEHPPAKLHILEPILFRHPLDINFHAHVAELAKIEIMALVVARPAEKHVTGGLQHSLPGDDSLALICISAPSRIRSEH